MFNGFDIIIIITNVFNHTHDDDDDHSSEQFLPPVTIRRRGISKRELFSPPKKLNHFSGSCFGLSCHHDYDHNDDDDDDHVVKDKMRVKVVTFSCSCYYFLLFLIWLMMSLRLLLLFWCYKKTSQVVTVQSLESASSVGLIIITHLMIIKYSMHVWSTFRKEGRVRGEKWFERRKWGERG